MDNLLEQDTPPITKHWLSLPGLTIYEAAFWMVTGNDPLAHEKRCAQDDAYANHFHDRLDVSEALEEGREVIISAIRCGLIKTTEDVRSDNGTLTSRTHIHKTDWISWCRDNGYKELANRWGSSQKVKYVSNLDEHTSTSAAQAQEKTSDKHDIKKERGCRRLIRENWDKIKTLHGIDADGHQVRRFLVGVIDKSEKTPALKTVQNCLITLRKDALIP